MTAGQIHLMITIDTSSDQIQKYSIVKFELDSLSEQTDPIGNQIDVQCPGCSMDLKIILHQELKSLECNDEYQSNYTHSVDIIVDRLSTCNDDTQTIDSCDEISQTKNSKKKSKKNTISIYKYKLPSNPEIIDILTNKCKLCDIKFSNIWSLKRHLVSVHDMTKNGYVVAEKQDYKCKICEKQFHGQSKSSAYKTHVRTCIPEIDKNTLTCKICNPPKQFEKIATLRQHYRLKHKIGKKICDECGKTFTRDQALFDHVQRHKNALPYTCDLCGAQLQCLEAVQKHMTLVHIGAKHICKACIPQKPFSRKFLLQRHIEAVHLKMKDIPCDYCPKMFSSKGILKNHVYAMHTPNEKKPKYSCDICGHVTTSLNRLKTHQFLHVPDDQKPFHCQYCKKGFIKQEDKNIHEMIHTNERPYQCKICGKGFKTRVDTRDHHLRQHTNEQPFVCDVCGKRFADRWQYRNHITVHEQEMGIALSKSVKKFLVNYDFGY